MGGLEQRWDMTCLSVLKRSALAFGWRRGRREGKGEGTRKQFQWVRRETFSGSDREETGRAEAGLGSMLKVKGRSSQPDLLMDWTWSVRGRGEAKMPPGLLTLAPGTGELSFLETGKLQEGLVC